MVAVGGNGEVCIAVGGKSMMYILCADARRWDQYRDVQL